MDIDILVISKARWHGNRFIRNNEFTTYYSGTSDNSHNKGVVIIIKFTLNNNVQLFVPLSDGVILIKLKNYPRPINIIHVYAPTADKPVNEIEQFYQQIEGVMKYIKKHEVNLLLGDFNAKVDSVKTTNILVTRSWKQKQTRGAID